jgi:type I site-specific restriction endonuclease
MLNIELPEYQFRVRQIGRKHEIFDSVRKKFVALTPEEWVRQRFIQYLIREKNIPATLIAIEKTLLYNTMKKRADIVAYSSKGYPVLMVECKSEDVDLSQKVFDQIAVYNIALKVPFLIITNGLKHLCCKIDFENASYTFLQEIPDYGYFVEKS